MNALRNAILIGDCRETLTRIESGSVHCCVTSPPYWNLRDYAVDCQIGLESSPQAYVSELVGLFSEIHRVLRHDGVLFLNIGDSYASGKGSCNNPGGRTGPNACLHSPHKSANVLPLHRGNISDLNHWGLKPKDMVGIPWMVAFAMRDFGWYLRQELIWHKPSPMPSSVKDRCTTSHEHVFLLSKSPRYYWDWYAISEPCVVGNNGSSFVSGKTVVGKNNLGTGTRTNGNRRNKRSVWSVTSEGFSGAHFAVFPTKLIEPMILAGSPEKCCAACGTGYQRQVETTRVATRPGNNSKVGRVSDDADSPYEGHNGAVVGNRDPQRHTTHYIDGGFVKSCECDTDESLAAIVLDPFAGSGTTAQVAQINGRDWIMCEGNPEYASMIEKRVQQGILF